MTKTNKGLDETLDGSESCVASSHMELEPNTPLQTFCISVSALIFKHNLLMDPHYWALFTCWYACVHCVTSSMVFQQFSTTETVTPCHFPQILCSACQTLIFSVSCIQVLMLLTRQSVVKFLVFTSPGLLQPSLSQQDNSADKKKI